MKPSIPVAVLIADVHYNINTLQLADASMRMAINKANDLDVPLIVAGDLHDTKANLRGECVNAMIETFKLANKKPYVLIGNHDKINEKSKEHSLNFLYSWANIVNDFRHKHHTAHGMHLVSYHSDAEELKNQLAYMKNRTIICHQGVLGSNSGEYIQDKSALPKEVFADFRVVSGHYHQRQDIQCGPPKPGKIGTFSYIGNPYTLNYGEANDPPKGFQILFEDGNLEFVPSNLRKHVVIEVELIGTGVSCRAYSVRPEDLVWVKLRGSKEALSKITKTRISELLKISENFKLDLIPTDTSAFVENTRLRGEELLDFMIDSLTNASEERKQRLKQVWKSL